MEEEELYECDLFRFRPSDCQWLEYGHEVRVAISSRGLEIRDWKGHRLIVDAPKQSILRVHVLPNFLFRIQFRTFDNNTTTNNSNESGQSFPSMSRIALRLANESRGESFITGLKTIGLPMETIDPSAYLRVDDELGLPDLHNPIVQRLVIQLLFSEDFHVFVDDLATLLTQVEKKITLHPDVTRTATRKRKADTQVDPSLALLIDHNKVRTAQHPVLKK